MSNRVMKMDKEPDVKHIKKVTANSTKTTATKDGLKGGGSANKSATKVFGMPCLPQHSD